MSPTEEVQEKAEEVRHPFDRKVAASMAAIAAALAIVAVLGHMFTTEELLTQEKAADQWAYFQAKSIRRYESEIAKDLLSAMQSSVAAGTVGKYAANAERYEKETEQIREKATELERESLLTGRRAQRLHFGEVFLEIAIVLASLAILTRRRPIWWTSMAAGVIGVVIAVSMRWIA